MCVRLLKVVHARSSKSPQIPSLLGITNKGRKHMKRHSRPYGCTFSGCSKSFGSKNDWMRHESSQHLDNNRFCCDAKPRGTDKVCNEEFDSRQDFRRHLKSDHGIQDESVIKLKLKSCPKFPESFWCGFCISDIDGMNQKAHGLDAWNERAKHIDGHFMGRNGEKKRSIQDWVHPSRTPAVTSQHSSQHQANSSLQESHVELPVDHKSAKADQESKPLEGSSQRQSTKRKFSRSSHSTRSKSFVIKEKVMMRICVSNTHDTSLSSHRGPQNDS